jgi:5-methylcytosine-specific restriction endonuclease McrA
MAFDKGAWQRARRRRFKEEHGYSMGRDSRRRFVAIHGYDSNALGRTGGLRQQVLDRDGCACVQCGMTDAEHKARWGRPITVDHIDRDKANNTLDNLQTLCLPCHGRKDLSLHLRVEQVPEYKDEILTRRAAGQGYRTIATAIGFSEAAIWTWVKRWAQEDAPCP